MTKTRGRKPRPADTKPPFSQQFWDRVELLRKYLHLSQMEMASLLGVTRLTYFKWITAKAWPQGGNIEVITQMTGRLAAIVKAKKWPTPEAMGMSPKQRFDRLVVLAGRRA
jgi:hypothetical protein